MAVLKEEKKVVFNEKELETYLQDIHNTGTFKLLYRDRNDSYSRFMLLGKVYSADNRYALLIKLENVHLEDLSRIYLSPGYNRDDLVGIYFREFNTLVFESSYEEGDLKEKCNSIKVFSRGDLINNIKEQLEKEFGQNRLHDLKRKYNTDTNQIEFVAFENSERIFKEIVSQKEEEREFVFSYWFKNKVGWHTIYEYLAHENKFIKQFADEYYEEEEGTVKNRVQYLLAKTMKAKEYQYSPAILKAQKVINLLENELKDAKNIWLVNGEGEKIQVPNLVRFDKSKVYVGNNWYGDPRMVVDDITTIIYGRTSYPV